MDEEAYLTDNKKENVMENMGNERSEINEIIENLS